MKNKEKARELAIKSTKHIDDNGKEVYNVFVEAALQEMAEWKEKQTIEKACEYIYSHAHVTTFGDIRLEKCSITEFIENFRIAMEE